MLDQGVCYGFRVVLDRQSGRTSDVKVVKRFYVVYAKTTRLADELIMKVVAAKPIGFAGLDLANCLNEAAFSCRCVRIRK